MSNEPVIRSLEAFVFHDASVGFVREHARGEARFLSPMAAKLAAEWRSFTPPAVVVDRVLASLSGLQRLRQRGDVEAAVAELLQSGALQTRDAFARSLADALGATPPTPRISTLAIPTANRPQLLQRALSSYLPHLKAKGRDVRVLVSDDSRDPALAEQNRAAASEAAKTHGARVEYLGQAERSKLIDEHAQGSAERRRALEFLLVDAQGLGLTYGMSRNAVLLATRGELFFSADDDTLCRLHQLPDRRAGLELYEGPAPAPMQSFVTRDAATGFARPLDADLLGEHERFLGRSLAAAMVDEARRPDFTVGELSGRAARRLLRGTDSVAFTVNGLVGDSGSVADLATRLMDFSPDGVRALAKSGALMELAGSRESVKLHGWARAQSSGNFMTTFYGHDNRRWVLPYFPFLRSEDQIFKELLVRSDPAAEIVYLPSALEHAPPQGSRTAPSPVVLLDVFLAALAEVPLPGPNASVPDRVRELGHHLVRFADRPLPRFRRAVYEVVATFTLQDIGARRAFLEQHQGKVPPLATEEVRSSLERLEKLLLEKEFRAAEQAWIQKLGSAEQAEELTRSTMRQMGEAMATLAG